MINFHAGALRPATDEARKMRLSAANDLVQRTLAQNGFVPGGAGGDTNAIPTALPSMSALMSKLSLPHGAARSSDIALREGAEFRSESFSCQAGTRAYRTYIPSTATEGVTGVVVMLHGCTQNPEDFANGTGMNALAEKHRFVVIYPE